ncbi:peptidase S11 [Microvirga tunisiensis]|uniref:Peptidase S11 n=1 Tax=Pannonibacter tanglangensis TaxID=2750084 RepID=A0ABW9ZIG9_9HYPH|nr:D-alanyl-D-alanine carboxypeptidase [Pannonibacter sp. XCT-34]NBN63742.1 peptidase S11 [Pannonibacter sp. XCT-34]
MRRFLAAFSFSRIARKIAQVAVVTACVVATPALAQQGPKYAGIVVDAKTGEVLYSDSADELRFPASLTKMMTLYVVFEDLEAGRIKLDTPMRVSARAAAQAPSKLGLRAGSTISVRDAILGLVTKSANDASMVIAEHIGGTEARFADRMTRTARQLGMSRSTFKNPHGLPNPGQRTTARDMALLGRALHERFPAYFDFFKTRSFNFRGRTHGNHNRLLGAVPGVNGIKTGYIRASGFNLVTSVERDGRHIVAVVMGGATGRSRDAQMVRLINQYMKEASTGRRTAPPIVSRSGPLALASAADDKPTAPLRVRAPLKAPVPDAKPDRAPAVVAAAPASAPVSAPVTAPRPAPVAEAPARVPAPTPAPAQAQASAAAPVRAPIPPRPVPAPAQQGESVAMTTGSIANPRFAATFDAVAAAPVETVPAPETQEAAAAPTTRVASLDPVMPVASARASDTTVTVATNNAAEAVPGWQVQIGAAESETAAIGLLKKARDATGASLRKTSLHTEPVNSNGQTLFRARFVGFEDKNDALAACRTLKRAKFNCYAVYQ